jgi:hypothetical protein
MIKWYLGAQNDGLFIIDQPPSTSNDYPNHMARVNVIAPVPVGAEDFAKAIVDAHNTNVDLKNAAECTHEQLTKPMSI